MSADPNMFLKNLDRTMLTFNMHNIAEVCFNHVFKRKAVPNAKLTPAQEQMIEECIEKYMQSFKVV